MNNILIIGLDLSFSSTGIAVSIIEDKIGKSIELHKLLFDENTSKKGKQFIPTPIQNLNQHTYRMPTNILVADIVLDNHDKNNLEQCEATLKAMICSKNIGKIVEEKINQIRPDKIIVVIENYIMPAFSGKNQLKTVSGLIMLQGFVRKLFIELCLANQIELKLYTPTPSSNKLFFTKDGNADKTKMVKIFLEAYDGNKLLPTITNNSVAIIHDVVDAFSLMMNAYKQLIK